MEVETRNREGSMEVVTAEHGPMGPLLGKLTALLADERGRLKGVRREIRTLRSELIGLHAALRNYIKLEDPDEQVKAWISLVRELTYDIEDVFDKFIHLLRNNNDRGHDGFKEFYRQTARRLKTLGSRRGIADQIDDLKSRIKQVKELKDSYKLDETPDGTTRHAAVDPRLRALFADEAQLVGIDGPRDALAKWMVEEENSSSMHHLQVVSIAGFGGLGKTTLAKQVYGKIQENFHCRAFVAVSQKPDIKKIFKNVIFDVISQLPCEDGFTKDIDSWDEMVAITKLRELLQDKRYLIMIDDLWSTTTWEVLRRAFPDNNCSSRIIVTTRIFEVAKSCCAADGDLIYKLQPLSVLHSKILFFRRIFGSEESCPDMLRKVSNDILKKCGGLPLAIIAVSGLLANRPIVKEEWEKVKMSIGYGLGENESLEEVRSILSYSYNDLTPNLKTCLLYLSIFPENYLIERERLVRRWIAEGFVSVEQGQSQQEVAENYFHELINKSMIQPVDIGYDGKARSCRVHDMILDLIISKSAEANFVTVVGSGQTSLTNGRGFIRRLSIQHIDQELAHALVNEDLSHVRSLTVTSSSCVKHLPSLNKFEALRVLDFEDCEGLEYIMNSLDKFFQLKYLGLKGTRIPKLPPGIVMLHDLETLDLRNTSLQKLPAEIVKLIKLKHLLTEGYCEVPHGIGNMRNLQMIRCFDITKSSVGAVKELENLASLNELDVKFDKGGCDTYKRHEEMLLSSLCKLGSYNLQSLVISMGNGSLDFLDSWSPLPYPLKKFWMSSKYYFTNIPKWIAPALTSLAYLIINLIELREEGVHALGELPALLDLKLSMRTGPKERLTVQGIGFPSLKNFVLISEAGAYVTFVKGAMPKLEKLQLPLHVSMAKTFDFYLGIEHLPYLKEAKVILDNLDGRRSEIKAAGTAIRNEAGVHPNHLTVTIINKVERVDNKETYSDEEKSMEDGDTDEN